jgi:hypothetical protein
VDEFESCRFRLDGSRGKVTSGDPVVESMLPRDLDEVAALDAEIFGADRRRFLGLKLAWGVGSGADMLRPLAIAVIGALCISVMLSLVATPVVYSLLVVPRNGDAGGARKRLWVPPAGCALSPTNSVHSVGGRLDPPARQSTIVPPWRT